MVLIIYITVNLSSYLLSVVFSPGSTSFVVVAKEDLADNPVNEPASGDVQSEAEGDFDDSIDYEGDLLHLAT